MSEKLMDLAKKISEKIKGIDNIRCISHYDADGISSACIVSKALSRSGKDFEISFVKELTEEKIRELKSYEEDFFLFTDIGSGQADKIKDIIERDFIISDHHEPVLPEKEYQVNPHLVGIDGSTQISGSGVTYLLMRFLNEENKDLIPYALVGAAGDIQKQDGKFLGLNENLAEDAEEMGFITVKKGLRIYGRSGKSLPRALTLTTEPYLPGITNNESGTVQFLSELGIDLKEDGKWRCLEDLSLEEEKKIVEGLIKRGYNTEKLLGDIYMLDNGWEVREFASLLNACGRLEKEEKGLEICLENDFEVAEKIRKEYGRRIGKYLRFLEKNLDNEKYFKDLHEAGIINAKEKIEENMIGTITTIAIKSDITSKDVLVGMAYAEGDKIKISGRITKDISENGFETNEILSKVCDSCKGEGGGHKIAAGGKIPRSEEERFIKLLTEELKRKLRGEISG